MTVINKYKDIKNIEQKVESKRNWLGTDRQSKEDEMFMKWTMIMGSNQEKGTPDPG